MMPMGKLGLYNRCWHESFRHQRVPLTYVLFLLIQESYYLYLWVLYTVLHFLSLFPPSFFCTLSNPSLPLVSLLFFSSYISYFTPPFPLYHSPHLLLLLLFSPAPVPPWRGSSGKEETPGAARHLADG